MPGRPQLATLPASGPARHFSMYEEPEPKECQMRRCLLSIEEAPLSSLRSPKHRAAVGNLVQYPPHEWRAGAPREEMRLRFSYYPAGDSSGCPILLISSDDYKAPSACWCRSSPVKGETCSRSSALLKTTARGWGADSISEVDLNKQFDHKRLGDHKNHIPRRPLR